MPPQAHICAAQAPLVVAWPVEAASTPATAFVSRQCLQTVHRHVTFPSRGSAAAVTPARTRCINPHTLVMNEHVCIAAACFTSVQNASVLCCLKSRCRHAVEKRGIISCLRNSRPGSSVRACRPKTAQQSGQAALTAITYHGNCRYGAQLCVPCPLLLSRTPCGTVNCPVFRRWW